MQHRLNFLPERQGHLVFRPTFGIGVGWGSAGLHKTQFPESLLIPETYFFRSLLGSGTKVANARLGESHRYKGADNQAITQTNWHSLTFYGSMADKAVTYDKGTNLFIEGTMQQRKFTPKDGSERTVMK